MKSLVIAVLALLSITVVFGEEVTQIKCYNCTIEETKYVDGEGKEQVNITIYDIDREEVLETCPEVTCNGGCVSALDNSTDTDLTYYRTCDEEEEVCDYFGIEEEFCTVNQCNTDLCNSQGSVSYTLGLVLLTVFNWCL